MKKIDVILNVIDEKNPLERKEIVEKSGIDTANVGTYLKRLINDQHIERLSYGEYTITEKGRKRADFIRQKYSNQKALNILESPIIKEIKKEEKQNTIDVKDLDFILSLKKKYDGNVEALNTLKRILN